MRENAKIKLHIYLTKMHQEIIFPIYLNEVMRVVFYVGIFWNINFSMLLYYYLSFDNKNFTKYSRTGFTCGSIWTLILVLFYFIIPLLYLCVPEARNLSTLFNRLLNAQSSANIIINICLCSVLIIFFWTTYEINELSTCKINRSKEFCYLTIIG